MITLYAILDVSFALNLFGQEAFDFYVLYGA